MEKSDLNEIRKKLDALGETCRQILMQFADGYTDREIAATMDYKTPDVVKTTRLRCLDKLRHLYSVTRDK